MKRDKNQKMPKTNNETLPYIDPAPFNQTIIINNPNININYINQGGNAKHNNHKTIIQTTLYNQKNKNSSNGLDNWNFNKNLKEFSETKQLGFYKKNDQSGSKNQHQSPYLIHKTKTQEIRNHVKNKAYNNLHSFRQQKTISTLKKQTLSPLEKEGHNSESKTKFRTKPYIQKKAKNPIDSSSNKLSNLELYSNGIIQNDKTLNIKEKIKGFADKGKDAFRKNRFMRSESPKNSSQSDRKQTEKDIQNMEESLILENKIEKKQQSKIPNRAIQKSIEKISHCFLKKVENYFDEFQSVDIPSSKIQLYTSTINQPSGVKSQRNQYRSSLPEQSFGVYDYEFQDQNLRKNKINISKPVYKRNRMYEEI